MVPVTQHESSPLESTPRKQAYPAANLISEHFMTERELALALGKSLRTIRRWAALREGPARTRVGKSLLYRKEAVMNWLSTQTERPCRTRTRGRR